MQLGKLEINLEELTNFIVEAKKSCYAGNGEEIILEDGSKQLSFKKGDFYYEDNYSGFYQALGREIVRWQKLDGQRIWQMSYSGGMLPGFLDNEEMAEKTFAFLKKALSQVKPEKPFRGPEDKNFQEENLGYNAYTNGDITRFKGYETIKEISKDSWSMILLTDYIGGLIIPK